MHIQKNLKKKIEKFENKLKKKVTGQSCPTR